jgi:hypothetical protein
MRVSKPGGDSEVIHQYCYFRFIQSSIGDCLFSFRVMLIHLVDKNNSIIIERTIDRRWTKGVLAVLADGIDILSIHNMAQYSKIAE